MPSHSVADSLLRGAVRRLARLYYPRLEVTGTHHIPKDGPVIFAANHPNSLLDPVIMGCAVQRPLRMLAKAPLFDIPLFGAAMRALGMLPAYRGSDNPREVAKNTETFAVAADALARGEAIGLFPEGKTHDALKVETARSGAARIAMQAVQAGTRNVKIVPVGITYENKERFRSAVWVRVGEALEAAPYLEATGGDASLAARRMTIELDKRLRAEAVHVDDESWTPFLDDLDALAPAPPAARTSPAAALRQRKRIADAMSYFREQDRARAEAVGAAIADHKRHLSDAGLSVRSPAMAVPGWRFAAALLWTPLWVIFWLGAALAGTIHHLAPFLIVRGLTRLVKTPGRTTISVARLCLGVPVYAAAYAFAWWWMSQYFRPWIAWTWMAAMPFAGVFALYYWPYAYTAVREWFPQMKAALARSELKRLRAEQAVIRGTLETMAEEFYQAKPGARESAPPVKPRSRKRILAWALAGTAAALLFAGFCLWRAYQPVAELRNPGPALGELDACGLEAHLKADEAALAAVLHGATELEARAVRVRDEFAAGTRNYYTQADNDEVRRLFLSFLAYRSTLLRLGWKYQRHADIADERLRLRAFLTGYTSVAALHALSVKLVTQFDRSPETVRKLNEADKVWDIPPRVYDTVRDQLRRSELVTRIEEAGREYELRRAQFTALGLDAAEPYALFHAQIGQAAHTRSVLGPGLWTERARATAREAKRVGTSIHYHAQAVIATWIGDTKMREPRAGRSLIAPEQLAELRAKLKPGDILIERRNWFLSNAFLPGFWPHAALYVGTPEELKALGLDQDERVKKHWTEFSAPDAAGHPHVIVEALSEGVVCASMEHSIGGGDAVAVLRPRLPPEKIKEAIARGFSHMGKDYDFEFDFFSTDKIVCTELVFRAYDGDIQFTLVDVMGRKTLPAIEIVRKHATERGSPRQQLDFIAFLDGDEATGSASFRDEDAFIGTLKRPGLDWLQGLAGE